MLLRRFLIFEADFVREARTLATFSHPNVMRILGCCPVPPNFMIVSELCSRGNLAKVLHGEQTTILTWHMRLFLALGAARGIAHVRIQSDAVSNVAVIIVSIVFISLFLLSSLKS